MWFLHSLGPLLLVPFNFLFDLRLVCSSKHVPEYESLAQNLYDKGVDNIFCVSVNDAWVMRGWEKDQRVAQVKMIADHNCNFTEAMNMTTVVPPLGNPRSHRYAAVFEDGKLTYFGLDLEGYDKSSPRAVLDNI